jgi:hypothetical protein
MDGKQHMTYYYKRTNRNMVKNIHIFVYHRSPICLVVLSRLKQVTMEYGNINIILKVKIMAFTRRSCSQGTAGFVFVCFC